MTSARPVRGHAILVGAAVSLALLFVIALVQYYRAFHFGVGATYAAFMLGLPSALLVALLAGYSFRWASRSRGEVLTRSSWWTLVVMAVAVGLLFALEWVRTSAERARDKLAGSVQTPNVALHQTGDRRKLAALAFVKSPAGELGRYSSTGSL